MSEHIQKTEHDAMVEEVWRRYLTTGEFGKERRQRHFFRLLPGAPRCKNCYAPFQGLGSRIVRMLYQKQPSKLNPQLCNFCDVFASRHQGGAEVELALLFADVRGSTPIAESMEPLAYSKLINRFYTTATQVMVRSDALIDKITGDQVAGIYVTGFAGPNYTARALEAAREILKATGHNSADGPWIPIGAGVHTDVAFVGSVGSPQGAYDITVLGDAANTTARLASSAKQGEILLSNAAYAAITPALGPLEQRQLQLKGKSDPLLVHVLPANQ